MTNPFQQRLRNFFVPGSNIDQTGFYNWADQIQSQVMRTSVLASVTVVPPSPAIGVAIGVAASNIVYVRQQNDIGTVDWVGYTVPDGQVFWVADQSRLMHRQAGSWVNTVAVSSGASVSVGAPLTGNGLPATPLGINFATMTPTQLANLIDAIQAQAAVLDDLRDSIFNSGLDANNARAIIDAIQADSGAGGALVDLFGSLSGSASSIFLDVGNINAPNANGVIWTQTVPILNVPARFQAQMMLEMDNNGLTSTNNLSVILEYSIDGGTTYLSHMTGTIESNNSGVKRYRSVSSTTIGASHIESATVEPPFPNMRSDGTFGRNNSNSLGAAAAAAWDTSVGAPVTNVMFRLRTTPSGAGNSGKVVRLVIRERKVVA